MGHQPLWETMPKRRKRLERVRKGKERDEEKEQEGRDVEERALAPKKLMPFQIDVRQSRPK
jgi:hypothetical protein